MKSEKNNMRAAFGAAAVTALAVLLAGRAVACGPFFPNNLLDGGDAAVLQPPVADFQRELERMNPAAAGPRAVMPAAGQNRDEQTAAAELADLTAALRAKHVPREEASAIIGFQLAQRAKLNAYLEELKARESVRVFVTDTNGENGYWGGATNPPPPVPELLPAPGLPAEFADYFKGVIEWRQGDTWKACEHWQHLLDLPPAERHYKSTWAEFMLGKHKAAYTNEYGQDEALKHFERVRALAAAGFADSAGLAVASGGLEAQIYLRREDYGRAIHLYLEQYAAGDGTAVQSLRTAAARVINGTNLMPEQLVALAKDSQARRVIDSYLISRNGYHATMDVPQPFTNGLASPQAWLTAVEAAGVHEVASAAQLALAAYQADDMVSAQRWVALAPREPVAQWLQAKLDMRAGKLDEAAKLLAKLCRRFPAAETNGTAAVFANNLSVQINVDEGDDFTAGQQLAGELGVLRLARREYAEALDALLHSGYWTDAAYVAERVLTAEELKLYVDRHWPALPGTAMGAEMPQWRGADGGVDPRGSIRYLLARRLARAGRYAEARDYYPAECRPAAAALMAGLRESTNGTVAALQRAEALFAAAGIMRTNGMELLGTELEPDWAIYEGAFELYSLGQARSNGVATAKINVADMNELARAAASGAEPDKRFHYRYQAAELAWRAAQGMPDEADETARVLCTAGAWLKYRDPVAADRFYKALVRRCGHTAIGRQADRMRWFPILDEQGQPKPWVPYLDNPGLLATNQFRTNDDGLVISEEFPLPGKGYYLHLGDTLAKVAEAASRSVGRIDLTNILAANPGLAVTNLEVGRLIVIPMAVTNAP